jgi:hypothetical protein
VVDDGASHRDWAAARRMSDAWPNVVMVHLPVHASRLNQIGEPRFDHPAQAAGPDDFADLPALAAKIGAFERRYNSAALQPGQRGPVIW